MSISNNVIMKLSKKAEIKSLSSDSYEPIKEIIDDKLLEILKITLSINTTKIIMKKDLLKSLTILNYNITNHT